MSPLIEDDEAWVSIGDAPVIADQSELVDGEPKDIVDADSDEVIQPGVGMPEPYVPSPAEVARHNLTHLPYRHWCPHCVRARRQCSHHRQKSPSFQRKVPLLVADYAQIRDSQDSDSRDWRRVLACLVAFS